MTEIQRLVKIKILKEILKEYELLAKYNDNGTDYDRYCALDMAIKELEQEPNWISCSERIDFLNNALDRTLTILDQKQNRDMDEIAEVMKSDADAETKCKMISNILTAKPHYFEKKEPCKDAISLEDLEECKELMTDVNGDTVYAVKMSEIRQLPPVNPQEPCGDTNANQHNANALNDIGQRINALEGDLISRQEVNNLQRYRYNCGETSITCVSLTDVNELPPVTPQPKTGYWIHSIYSEEGKDVYKCSCCGKEIEVPIESRDDLYIDYPYCHCGAKMESEVRNEKDMSIFN